MRQSQRLLGDADAIAQFVAAYDRLGTLEGSVAPGARPAKAREDQAELETLLAQIAGPASAAFERSGMRVSMHGIEANPVLNWSVAPPDGLISSCNAAIGKLRFQAVDARQVERSLAGRVARFVGFPAAVRAAMPATSRGARRAGLIAGIAVQVVTAVVTAGVLALIGLAISKLF